MSDSAPRRVFPAYDEPLRLPGVALPTFSKHWRFKRELRDQFRTTWGEAHRALSGFELRQLPPEIRREWEARWAISVFKCYVGVGHNHSDDQLASTVEDIGAVVEALQFVTANRAEWSAARPTYVYEYRDCHRSGRAGFPNVKQAEEDRRDREIAGDYDYDPLALDDYPRYDLRNFLIRAAFLLSPGVTDGLSTTYSPQQPNYLIGVRDRDWLTRLAVRTSPDECVWGDPPDFEDWARSVFTDTLPVLSRKLRLTCPLEVQDRAVPFSFLVTAVQNWWAGADRELKGRGIITLHTSAAGAVAAGAATKEPSKTTSHSGAVSIPPLNDPPRPPRRRKKARTKPLANLSDEQKNILNEWKRWSNEQRRRGTRPLIETFVSHLLDAHGIRTKPGDVKRLRNLVDKRSVRRQE